MRIERRVLFWFGAFLLLLGAIAVLREILLPFVLGIAVAYFLNPIADRLQRLGLNRTLAALVMVLLVAVVVIAGMLWLVPLVADQLRQLTTTLPRDIERMKGGLEAWAQARLGDYFPTFRSGLERAVAELTNNSTAIVTALAKSLWSQGQAVMNIISLALVTPLVVFYLLVDWHPMLERIDGWLPREHAATIRRLGGEINEALSAFVRGQGTICIILAIFYAVALAWIGVPYGALIGLAAGLFAFVPFVGWALGLLAAGTLAAIQFWPNAMPLAMVAGVFVAGMVLDSALLSPRIVGEKIGVHPVWLMFALFAFSYLFGSVGMLVAVPVAAAIAVLVRYGLELYLASDVYTGVDEKDVAAGGPKGVGPTT